MFSSVVPRPSKTQTLPVGPGTNYESLSAPTSSVHEPDSGGRRKPWQSRSVAGDELQSELRAMLQDQQEQLMHRLADWMAQWDGQVKRSLEALVADCRSNLDQVVWHFQEAEAAGPAASKAARGGLSPLQPCLPCAIADAAAGGGGAGVATTGQSQGSAKSPSFGGEISADRRHVEDDGCSEHWDDVDKPADEKLHPDWRRRIEPKRTLSGILDQHRGGSPPERASGSAGAILRNGTHISFCEDASDQDGSQDIAAKTIDEAEEEEEGRSTTRSKKCARRSVVPVDTSHPWRVAVKRFLKSTTVELFLGATIMSNALFIGVEIDFTASTLDEPLPDAFAVIGHAYTTIFAVELGLKLFAFGSDFFCHLPTKELVWNYLDLIIVVSSLVEVSLDIVSLVLQSNSDSQGTDGMDMGNLRIIRIIRLSRLMRLFRIGRIVRFVRALRTLVFSIVSTLKSVFWSMLLMVIIIYVFAILFTQCVNDYKVSVTYGGAEELDDIWAEKLDYHWGTLIDSMLSLYMSISGGVSWWDVSRPLKEVGSVWLCIFLVYISFVYFAVLNVVTGVFCQSAIECTQHDQDAMIQSFLANKNLYTQRFQELFKTLDSDRSGVVSKDEFMDHINNPSVQAYFATLELDASDAIQLFRLIDSEDGTNEGIDIEDFVMGCLRLKGNARSCDIARLMYENKALAKDIAELGLYIEAQFKSLNALVGEKAPQARDYIRPSVQAKDVQTYRSPRATMGPTSRQRHDSSPL